MIIRPPRRRPPLGSAATDAIPSTRSHTPPQATPARVKWHAARRLVFVVPQPASSADPGPVVVTGATARGPIGEGAGAAVAVPVARTSRRSHSSTGERASARRSRSRGGPSTQRSRSGGSGSAVDRAHGAGGSSSAGRQATLSWTERLLPGGTWPTAPRWPDGVRPFSSGAVREPRGVPTSSSSDSGGDAPSTIEATRSMASRATNGAALSAGEEAASGGVSVPRRSVPTPARHARAHHVRSSPGRIASGGAVKDSVDGQASRSVPSAAHGKRVRSRRGTTPGSVAASPSSCRESVKEQARSTKSTSSDHSPPARGGRPRLSPEIIDVDALYE